MPADILHFPRKTKPAVLFADFDEVFEYTFNPDIAADSAKLEAWFEWFGVKVDMFGSAQSLLEGWCFLRSEIGSAAHYRRDNPRIFKNLHDDWTRTQVDYLDAVIRGDAAEARALLPNTPLWLGLADKMETEDGSALLSTRP
jgi:hypothetical protein